MPYAKTTTTATKTSPKKLNSRCFRLYRAYFISFNSPNVGKFLWSWIIRIVSKFTKRKRKLLFCVPVLTPQNVKLVVVVAWISSDYFESLLLPQLRGENDSKQSDEFQAIVVVQRRLRNVPKTVIHVQNSLCYFANLTCLNLLLFLLFSLPSPSSLPINTWREKRLELASISPESDQLQLSPSFINTS